MRIILHTMRSLCERFYRSSPSLSQMRVLPALLRGSCVQMREDLFLMNKYLLACVLDHERVHWVWIRAVYQIRWSELWPSLFHAAYMTSGDLHRKYCTLGLIMFSVVKKIYMAQLWLKVYTNSSAPN